MNIYKSLSISKCMEKKSFKVTPWEVEGKIDYNKLIKEFGISLIKDLPEIFAKETLFRRKIIFAHRNIQRILLAIKEKKPLAMMTGLMPTGKFHIGHMILAQQIIFYQKIGAKIYVAVADVETYNTRGIGLKEARKTALEEYILNYIALGLDINNCEIYFQSNRSNVAAKANAIIDCRIFLPATPHLMSLRRFTGRFLLEK